MGSIGFVITTLAVTAGIAGAPWLLPRCTTTLGVYEEGGRIFVACPREVAFQAHFNSLGCRGS